MESLYDIWLKHQKDQDLRLRYCDWNHRIKYVRIVAEAEGGDLLKGVLATGEIIHFPKSSPFWDVYHEGDEEQARAV